MRIPSNKIQSVCRFFLQELEGRFDRPEAESMMRIAFEDLLGIKPVELLARQEETLTESELLKIIFLLKDLRKGIPLQYSIGFTWFSGLKIKCDSRALIPRPETEELVMHAVNFLKTVNDKQANVLDIGTGTGCIALALKQEVPIASVTAIDKSEDALELAAENGKLNDLNVRFQTGDITDFNSMPSTPFDLIVSNPPYIPPSEKASLSELVKGNEPHEALFTPNEDPLYYYRYIRDYAAEKLRQDGRVYLELHEDFAEDTVGMMKEKFNNVTLMLDMHNKNRMLCAY